MTQAIAAACAFFVVWIVIATLWAIHEQLKAANKQLAQLVQLLRQAPPPPAPPSAPEAPPQAPSQSPPEAG